MIDTLSSLHPWFITGFTDGEGCFIISITRRKTAKLEWHVQLYFQIGLHKKDQALLEKIKNFFNVGKIFVKNDDSIQYSVQSIKDLAIIIEHFDRYPLLSQKLADYELFKKAFYIIKNKEHLTTEGLNKIMSIKASMNLGLSEELKTAFLDVLPVPRPSVVDQDIKDPNWCRWFYFCRRMFFYSHV